MGPGQDNAKVESLMALKKCYQARLDKQRGFSLFEMVLVVLLIGVLVTIAVDRLLQLQIEAERISVRHVIGTLESAVYLQVAEMVVKQGLDSVRQLENANPMDYLQKLPNNYVGVKNSEAASQVPVLNWYFDSVDDVLVYKVQNKKYFESEIEGEPRIILKLFLVFRDDVKSRRSSNIQGIKLGSLHEYSWKIIDE